MAPRSATILNQLWIGGSDFGWVLGSIGSWAVDCAYDRENRAAVVYADEQGYLGRRLHYAPAFPEGLECYELTDKGLKRLAQLQGDEMAENCRISRERYREYARLFTQDPKLAAEYIYKTLNRDPAQSLKPERATVTPTESQTEAAIREAVAALRFLAEHDRPAGGQSRYNSEHLHQIADELERSVR